MAAVKQGAKEIIIGIGQYIIIEKTGLAEAAFIVRDDYQGQGIGSEILSFLITTAQKAGLDGFTASILTSNKAVGHIIEKTGLKIEKKIDGGSIDYRMMF